MSFDIELATLRNDMPDFLNEIQSVLPEEYFLEDKTSMGWGVVVRAFGKSDLTDLDAAIEKFLLPLVGLRINSFHNDTILRVGVFNSSTVCNLTLKNYDLLISMGAALELSVYPVGD